MMFFRPNKITVSILLLAVTIGIGTAGFWFIDNYPTVDALYMSVITITTVGFGEIYPLSEAGRLFAVVLILIGFVVLGFVGHSIVESLLERVWSGNVREKRMKKRIERLSNHYIICGFGRVGEVAAQHLKEAGADFIVIEPTINMEETFTDDVPLHIVGDATREKVLLEARIKHASGLLALVDSDPLNLFIVLTARELNPTLHIIARSEERDTEKKILRAGADSIISPFESAGRRIADKLLSATGRNTDGTAEINLEGNTQPEWLTVDDSPGLLGLAVGETGETTGRIIGLRRDGRDYLLPDPKEKLTTGDQILLIPNTKEFSRHAANPFAGKKLVIIDDNPVIVRLFSRLFHKEGFNPLCAANGREGFDLIVDKQPEVAVIDYMLPGMSGLDVCRNLKRIGFDRRVKLVVFTAEDDESVREQCLAAGAHAVIVKSADAGEIIDTVKGLLR